MRTRLATNRYVSRKKRRSDALRVAPTIRCSGRGIMSARSQPGTWVPTAATAQNGRDRSAGVWRENVNVRSRHPVGGRRGGDNNLAAAVPLRRRRTPSPCDSRKSRTLRKGPRVKKRDPASDAASGLQGDLYFSRHITVLPSTLLHWNMLHFALHWTDSDSHYINYRTDGPDSTDLPIVLYILTDWIQCKHNNLTYIICYSSLSMANR